MVSKASLMLHSFEGRRPLFKKTFYLDLRNFPHEAKLVKDLKRLGGKQETFLSKDVTFVVTDRVVSHNDAWMSPMPYVSHPSPQPFYQGNWENLESPPYTNSPPPERSLNDYMYRGQSLVKNALQNRKGSADVLEVCKKWSITVIHLKDLVSWLNKNNKLFILKNRKEKDMQINGIHKNASYLQAPFLKIEDVKRKFRPRHRVVNSWKDCFDRDITYAMNQLSAKMQKFELGTKLDDNFFKPVLRESNHQPVFLKPICSPTYTPRSLSTSKTVSGQFNANRHASNSVQFSTERKKEVESNAKKDDTKVDKNCKKKSKRRYCEICHYYYTDLDKHLTSEVHQKYLQNDSNFKCVKEVISEFSSVEEFLKSTSLQKSTVCENIEQDSDSPPVLETEDSNMPGSRTSEMPLLETNEGLFRSETDIYYGHSDCISGSCPTDDLHKTFPFLEDTLDAKLPLVGDDKKVSINKLPHLNFSDCPSQNKEGDDQMHDMESIKADVLLRLADIPSDEASLELDGKENFIDCSVVLEKLNVDVDGKVIDYSVKHNQQYENACEAINDLLVAPLDFSLAQNSVGKDFRCEDDSVHCNEEEGPDIADIISDDKDLFFAEALNVVKRDYFSSNIYQSMKPRSPSQSIFEEFTEEMDEDEDWENLQQEVDGLCRTFCEDNYSVALDLTVKQFNTVA